MTDQTTAIPCQCARTWRSFGLFVPQAADQGVRNAWPSRDVMVPMTGRVASFSILIGLAFLAMSIFELASDNLLHIGGVGFVVAGAMAFSINAEMPDAGPSPVIRSDRTSRRPQRGRHAKPLFAPRRS